MSLNQLPDELIAHIGTFLSSKDNSQLAQSQKRINNVLKRDGLTKPEVYSVSYQDEVSNEYLVYKTKYNYNYDIYTERVLPKTDRFKASIGKILNEFRSIDVLIIGVPIEGKNAILGLGELLLTKTKINRLEFDGAWLFLEDWDIFIDVCKKYKTIINDCLISESFYKDKVNFPLLPATMINLSMEMEYPDDFNFDHPNLTDRTLEALSASKGEQTFAISGSQNAFTTKGIRKLVETLVKKGSFDVTFDLGILKFEEEIYAENWLREVQEGGFEDFMFISKKMYFLLVLHGANSQRKFLLQT